MIPTPSSIALFQTPFYFLRHGETVSNAAGLIAGSSDVELTERGHAQARAAALRLRATPIARIYTSVLRRAHETARYVAAALDRPLVTLPQLNERCWGELEGRPRTERRPGITPLGAETPEQFRARIMAGLACIEEGGPVLLVAHSGVHRLLCRELGIPDRATPVANALGLKFMPRPGGTGWELVAV